MASQNGKLPTVPIQRDNTANKEMGCQAERAIKNFMEAVKR
jgi:hypothetical protein